MCLERWRRVLWPVACEPDYRQWCLHLQRAAAEVHGQWLDSQKHGLGYYEWPDGRVYQGQYWQDQASGFGAFAWPDGQRYEGYWHVGKQHGAGHYTDQTGQTRHLTWADGRPQEAIALSPC